MTALDRVVSQESRRIIDGLIDDFSEEINWWVKFLGDDDMEVNTDEIFSELKTKALE